MTECRRNLLAQSLEDLDLDGRVGHVVLAPDDVGDREVHIVDDGRQSVKVRSVLADQHRVRQGCTIDVALAADEVVPGDGLLIELEAPMRTPPLRVVAGFYLGGQRQGCTVIDRRQAARLQALAAPVELVGGFVSRVEPATLLQSFGRRGIERRPFGLPHDEIRNHAEPFEIVRDRLGVFDAGALGVRIVEAQHEAPVAGLGEKIVQQCRPGIADMDAPGGRRGEADDGVWHERLMAEPLWRRNRRHHGKAPPPLVTVAYRLDVSSV